MWRTDSDDNVSVIDTATNNVTATVPVGEVPHGVAIVTFGQTQSKNTRELMSNLNTEPQPNPSNTINLPAPSQRPVETSSQTYVQHTVKENAQSLNNNNRNALTPPQSPVKTPSSLSDTFTELISSANEYTSGQPVTFTAEVETKSQETEKPSGTVTFRDGAMQLRNETVNFGKAILTISNISVGSHSITAQYIGNNYFKPSTSPAFTLTIEGKPWFQNPLYDAIKTFCGIIAAIVGLIGMFKTYVKLKKP